MNIKGLKLKAEKNCHNCWVELKDNQDFYDWIFKNEFVRFFSMNFLLLKMVNFLSENYIHDI